MFAPTFSLETVRPVAPTHKCTHRLRSRALALVKVPALAVIACALSLGFSTLAQAQSTTPPRVIIQGPSNSIPEGSGGSTSIVANFQVSLSNSYTSDVTVTVATKDGTAVAFTPMQPLGDYIPVTQTLTFAAGTTGPQSVNVPIVSDDLYEVRSGNIRTETFSLAATGATGGATITNNPSAQATIADDDTAPVLTIDDRPDITEGNSGTTNANFTVNLSAAAGQNTTFTYSTGNDPNAGSNAATADVDYVSKTNVTGTIIPAGSQQVQITVPIIGDTTDEADESFAVNLSNAQSGGATIAISDNQAIGTILDDDGPQVSVNDSRVTEGNNATFQITLSAPSPSTVTINYSFTDNSATNGADYTGTNGTVTFFPGDTVQEVTVPTISDGVFEGTENFVINLSGASAGTTIRDGQGVGTITDSPPVVSVSDVTQAEGTGSNSTFNFVVTLTSSSTTSTSVLYRTTNGSATSSSDFNGVSGTLTFAPGETSKTIPVTVIGDSIDEVDEKFNLVLSNPQPRGVTFSNGGNSVTATGTIIDDDGPSFSFENTSVSTTEGNSGTRTTTPFYVRLSSASTRSVSVRFSIAQGTATYRTDFVRTAGTSGTLTFAPGVTRLPINVDIVGDNTDEPDETFTITLSNPNGGTVAPNLGVATGIIVDDDRTPVISINNVSATEGNNGTKAFNFSVTLDRPSSQVITVDYTTADDTATVANGDYSTASGTLTFNPGVSKQTLTVFVNGDTLDEPDAETFRVILTNAMNATLSGRANVGIGTINDDDATPQLSISAPTPVVEGAAVTGTATPLTLNFTVSVVSSNGNITASGRVITFRYQTVQPKNVSGSLYPATAGDDFTSADTTMDIPAGQSSVTIPITVNGDAKVENDEYFQVVISQPRNAQPTPRVSTATGVILDDDKGTVSVKAPAADDTAIEPGYLDPIGRRAIFPVTLSAAGSTAVISYVIEANGTTDRANPIADLAPVDSNGRIQTGQTTGTITIPEGSTEGNIVIAAINDSPTLNEPLLENYRVRLTGITPSGYTIPTGTATGGGTGGGTGGTGGGTATGGNQAVSTVTDSDAGFTSFTPKEGNQAFNPGLSNATTVVITGNQFIINGVPQIQNVVFGFTGGSTRTVSTSDFTIDSDTQISVDVPAGARSGRIQLITNDGVAISPSGSKADVNFYANAVVTDFSPDRGVERNTVVVITGANFDDPLNPVKEVRFNGLASNARTAGVDYQIFSEGGQRKIRATVPFGATSGPITIATTKGTMYPPSTDAFQVDTITPGGLRFAESGTFGSVENARGTVANPASPKPVLSFTLELKPALDNSTQAQVTPRGQITARVTITDDVAPNLRTRLPRISVSTGRVTQISAQTYDITFDAGQFQSKTIDVIDMGDDIVQPSFVTGGFFQQQTPRNVTLSGFIKTSNTLDSAIYPTNAAANDITILRNDLHGLDTDIGATLRTTEDQGSPRNITSFKLNLRNINNGVDISNPDAFGDGTGVATRKYSISPQPSVTNPDGTINTDAEPDSDVFLPFTVNKPDEALIRYYVRIPTGPTTFRKAYPEDAVFRPTVTVRYSTDPTDEEYYKYDHYIEVKGVDDQLQDGSQTYQVLLDQSTTQNPIQNSTDPEFQLVNLVTPFTLTNEDNEQSVGNDEPGFVFMSTNMSGTPLVPQLVTNEAGKTDFFTVRLRSRPTSGKVTLRFQTSNPSEVLLLDPTTGAKVDTLDIVFYADSRSSYQKNESRYDVPQTVRVIGVNDNNLDGNQTVTLLTSTVDSQTDDAAYDTIDPIDPVVVNGAAGPITVSPTNLSIPEGSTRTFSVVLNSQPSGEVNIPLSSSDPSVAVTTVTQLTFDPSNYNVPQNVTVRGVVDNSFNQRSATIILGTTSSSDTAFNNINPTDVQVTVPNMSQAYIITPPTATTTGLTTSEDGSTDLFGVRLANAPTANVVITLSVSNSSEALLSASGQTRSSSVQLTFTPSNFATVQNVTVIGQDDTVKDGDQSFTINGTITPSGTIYDQQPFPTIVGTNTDNDGNTTNNGITFAANGTYNVSFPYATGTAANSTITAAQAFGTSTGYTLYRFNTTGQRNSRALTTGTDFVAVSPSDALVRGVGYRLVTGSSAITLRTPATSKAVNAYTGMTFPLTLTWNFNFLDDTSSTNNLNNGYNFIGFPLDPSKYSGIPYASSQVTYDGQTYESIADASAAGIISDQLYTVDAQGNLTALASSDRVLRPYRAYFVRILRNDPNKTVTLTLRNPTVSSP